MSNTSTGRGQVTNTIVDALIDFARTGKEKIKFKDLLNAPKVSAKIRSFNGDPETIKVYSLGEALLDYVLS